MRALWLADVLRDAGLTVHEVPGWRSRGDDSFGPIRGITCHHTAGSRNSTDAGEIGVLINGRPGLSGPIAQLYLSRTGAWHVVASGRANHNKVGWAGPNKGYGNSNLIGVEAQHSGGDEPWTDRQYDSYVRGVAALVRHLGIAASRVGGHKEHQPGEKSDPTFSMPTFRSRVQAEISDWEDEDMKPEDIQAIKAEILGDGGVQQLLSRVEALASGRDPHTDGKQANVLHQRIAGLSKQLATLTAQISALGGQVADVDEQVIAQLRGKDVQETAKLLQAALGDDAPEVGRLLAGLTA